jgi:hypothetical protein
MHPMVADLVFTSVVCHVLYQIPLLEASHEEMLLRVLVSDGSRICPSVCSP